MYQHHPLFNHVKFLIVVIEQRIVSIPRVTLYHLLFRFTLSALVQVKGGIENKHGKANILLQAREQLCFSFHARLMSFSLKYSSRKCNFCC